MEVSNSSNTDSPISSGDGNCLYSGNFTNCLNISSTPAPEIEPMRTDVAAVICIVSAGLSFITIAGNMLVIAAFRVNRKLQTITNYFILSLAVADLIVGLISMNLFTSFVVQRQWAHGAWLCDLWLTVDYVASNASVMNLLAISLDRYLSITRPFRYRTLRTKSNIRIGIGFAWAISFLLWALPIILFPIVEGRKVPENDCYIQFIQSNPYVTFGTAMLAFYIPTAVMAGLNWRIYRENVKHLEYRGAFLARPALEKKQLVIALKDFANAKLTDESSSQNHGQSSEGIQQHTMKSSIGDSSSLAKNDTNGILEINPEDQEPGFIESETDHINTQKNLQDENGNEKAELPVSASNTSALKRQSLTKISANGIPQTAHDREDVTTPFLESESDCDRQLSKNKTGNEKRHSDHHSLLSEIMNHLFKNGIHGDKKDEIKKARSRDSIISIRHDSRFSKESQEDNDEEEGCSNVQKPFITFAMSNSIGMEAIALNPAPTSPNSPFRRSASERISVTSMEKKSVATRRMQFAMDRSKSVPETRIDDESETTNGLAEVIAAQRKNARDQVSATCKKDNKAARMLLTIVLVFVITWLPYNILVLISSLCINCVNDILWKLSYYLCYLNSTINPVCYALCSKEFRRTFRYLLQCKKVPTLRRT